MNFPHAEWTSPPSQIDARGVRNEVTAVSAEALPAAYHPAPGNVASRKRPPPDDDHAAARHQQVEAGSRQYLSPPPPLSLLARCALYPADLRNSWQAAHRKAQEEGHLNQDYETQTDVTADNINDESQDACENHQVGSQEEAAVVNTVAAQNVTRALGLAASQATVAENWQSTHDSNGESANQNAVLPSQILHAGCSNNLPLMTFQSTPANASEGVEVAPANMSSQVMPPVPQQFLPGIGAPHGNVSNLCLPNQPMMATNDLLSYAVLVNILQNSFAHGNAISQYVLNRPQGGALAQEATSIDILQQLQQLQQQSPPQMQLQVPTVTTAPAPHLNLRTDYAGLHDESNQAVAGNVQTDATATNITEHMTNVHAIQSNGACFPQQPRNNALGEDAVAIQVQPFSGTANQNVGTHKSQDLVVRPGLSLEVLRAQRDRGGSNEKYSFLSESIHKSALPKHVTQAQEEDPKERCIPLWTDEDEARLSTQQCWLRKQLETFPASPKDVRRHTRGRNRSLILGQVGIQCRHCKKLPPEGRGKGYSYFPSSTKCIYQAAQNILSYHYKEDTCPLVPQRLLRTMREAGEASTISPQMAPKAGKSRAGGGKRFWSLAADSITGLVDTTTGIRYTNDNSAQYFPLASVALGASGGRPEASPSVDVNVHVSSLTRIEDQVTVTEFCFALMSQFEPYSSQKLCNGDDGDAACDATSKGKEQDVCSGKKEREEWELDSENDEDERQFGITCRFCESQSGIFLSFKSNTMMRNKNLMRLYTHVLSCECAPKEVKEILEKAKVIHLPQSDQLKKGWKKAFFENVMCRLRRDLFGVEEDQAGMLD